MNNTLENRIARLEKLMSLKNEEAPSVMAKDDGVDRIKLLKTMERITNKFINDLSEVVMPAANQVADNRLIARCERTMQAAERIITMIDNLYEENKTGMSIFTTK